MISLRFFFSKKLKWKISDENLNQMSWPSFSGLRSFAMKMKILNLYIWINISFYKYENISIAARRSHHIHADISTCKFCKMKYWYFLIIRITTRNMDEKVAQLLLRKKTNKSSMVLEITVGSHVVPEIVLEVVVVYISLQRLKRLCA